MSDVIIQFGYRLSSLHFSFLIHILEMKKEKERKNYRGTKLNLPSLFSMYFFLFILARLRLYHVIIVIVRIPFLYIRLYRIILTALGQV